MRKRAKKRGAKRIMRDKAWKVFSLWIRNRDKRCVTCGSTSTLQAGHFWHAVMDFDERNINAQCSACNHFRSGNLAQYSLYLLNKLGEEGFKQLEADKYKAIAGEYRTEEEYQAIIDKYSLSK